MVKRRVIIALILAGILLALGSIVISHSLIGDNENATILIAQKDGAKSTRYACANVANEILEIKRLAREESRKIDIPEELAQQVVEIAMNATQNLDELEEVIVEEPIYVETVSTTIEEKHSEPVEIKEELVQENTEPVEEQQKPVEEPKEEVKEEPKEKIIETSVEEVIPNYSIGLPGGQMKGYRGLSRDEFYYNLQEIIDQGSIVHYSNYFAGHNPGAMSHLSSIGIGSIVRVSYDGSYNDYTIVDCTTGTGSFDEVNFPSYGNLWTIVQSGQGIVIQFCIGGQNHLFYGI